MAAWVINPIAGAPSQSSASLRASVWWHLKEVNGNGMNKLNYNEYKMSLKIGKVSLKKLVIMQYNDDSNNSLS